MGNGRASGRHADSSGWNEAGSSERRQKESRLELGRRGGAFKGTDGDEQEEDGEQGGSCPTKLSVEPGVEICRPSWT